MAVAGDSAAVVVCAWEREWLVVTVDFLLRFRHGLFFGIRNIGLGFGAEAWDFVGIGGVSVRLVKGSSEYNQKETKLDLTLTKCFDSFL